MKAYGATDIGLHRAENQDSFSISEHGAFTVAVVCDGMGGATAGKTASSIAVNNFVSTLSSLLREDASLEQVREMASFSVAQANHAVYEKSQDDVNCRGMGTTLVCAVCRGDEAVICNVGDSRAYLMSGESFSRITHDHSVVETMVEKGNITEEEARTHPNRNLITRALGPESSIRCDTYTVKLEKNDLLLLCSDGLVVTAEDNEISYILQEENSCADRLEQLINLSREHGAPDNVTALLLENQ